MNFFRIFLVTLAILFISAKPSHKFYVSITTIEYSQEKKSLQIITKIFIDDIENALRKRYDPTISLGTQREKSQDDAFLEKYILQKLKVKVNGKPAKLKYLGQEYEPDMVVAYIEVTEVDNLKTITVENEVLTGMFPEQQNIVHLKTPNSRRSLILTKDKPGGTLNFRD